MFVEPIYKGFRIQVEAVVVEGRWDALVNIHRVLPGEKPHIDQITCRHLTAESRRATGIDLGPVCPCVN
jgi:hypothetical protein